MNNLPFAKPGQFYKGNLHTHSTNSDGRISVEARCASSTGSTVTTSCPSPITFWKTTAIRTPMRRLTTRRISSPCAGRNCTRANPVLGELWHILANGLPLDFARPTPDETGPEIAQRALATGAFVTVAHPAWYNLSEEDVISLSDTHAIEIINGISADHSDKIDSVYMLDVMLARGYRFTALATDDAHFKPDFRDTLRGWTWVKSEALTPEAILAALKRGDFYSSTGPLIHDVQVTPGETIKIRCSPCESVFVTGKGSWAAYKHGHNITEVELSIRSLKSPTAVSPCAMLMAGARGRTRSGSRR
ncbi:phosphotransferase [Candidatus Flexifilum breve]|uniref:phosphotransferase n=1 Tax=Candidatus Flexifilum breve TaxID=3140694 RepID=UPI0031CC7097